MCAKRSLRSPSPFSRASLVDASCSLRRGNYIAMTGTFAYAKLFSHRCVVSGFRRGVNEIFALLEFYAAYIASLSPTFRDNLSVPSSRVKQSKTLEESWRWKRQVVPNLWQKKKYQHTLRKIPEERRSSHPFNNRWMIKENLGKVSRQMPDTILWVDLAASHWLLRQARWYPLALS
jgi:hypothetical protein